MFYTKWNNSLSSTELDQLKSFITTQDCTLNTDCSQLIEATVNNLIEDIQSQQPLSTSELKRMREELDPVYVWRTAHLQAHLKHLPYPLSRKAIDFVQQRFRIEEGENFPQFAYLLTATVSLMVRQWAICSIQAYLTVFKGNDPTMNTLIVQTLRKPTDNQWWNLVCSLTQWMMGKTKKSKGNRRVLDGHPISHFVLEMHNSIKMSINLSPLEKSHTLSTYSKKPLSKLTNVEQGMKHLLDFRNALIHALTIDDEDIDKASIVLESVLEATLSLNRFHLATKVGLKEYLLQGLFPKLVESPNWTSTIEDKELVLLMDEQTYLCTISPLMSLAHDIDSLDVDQEIFFINAGSLNLLNYVGFVNGEHKDGKSLGSYDQFKRYITSIPVPQGATDRPLINFSHFVANKTKNFVGRTDVLAEIHECVSMRGGHYCFLQALPGMGKSAIMARLFQLHPYRTDDDKRTNGDIWLYHYCMQNDGRDQALTALRSLITQMQFAKDGNEGKRPSMKVDDLKEEFQRLLNTSQKTVERRGGSKVVVVIDALDEASFMGDDSIPSCIPEYIADHVVFICSYRVDATCTNTRVQNHLQHLPKEKIYTFKTAKPLRGLDRNNVHTFIDLISDGEDIQESTLEHIWRAASQDLIDAADPFYLRFVADGVEKNQYFLKHPETIPTSLNGAFEKMWLSLPSDRNFLAHRLLVTLGIMRDLGDDELFAELFNRQFPSESFTVDDIATIRRPIGKLLSYDGDRYGLFHDRFKHFLVGEQPDPIEQALQTKQQ